MATMELEEPSVACTSANATTLGVGEVLIVVTESNKKLEEHAAANTPADETTIGVGKELMIVTESNIKLQERLLEAIKKKKRHDVKDILTTYPKKTILEIMKYCVKESEKFDDVFICEYNSLLRMLIKDMPGMAELFLDMCITKSGDNVTIDYHYIDDFTTKWVQSYINPSGIQEHREETVTPIDIPKQICFSLLQIILFLCSMPLLIPMILCTCKGWKNERAMPECHPVSLMKNLLKHVVVKKWIEQKWNKETCRFYIPYIITQIVFLAIITSFALVSPRPVENPFCNATYSNETTYYLCTAQEMTALNTTSLPSPQYNAVLSLAIIIIFLASVLLFHEYFQMAAQQIYYFKEWENLIQVFVYIGAIVFASNFCGCNSNIWQLGALVVALAWFNMTLLLRCVPSIGAPINLFILIITNYVKLIYLPILLVGTFGVPFYMLFIRNAQGVAAAGGQLTSFVSPSWALLRTLHATSGDTGFEEIFLSAPLPYQVMGLILFIAFLILVLILFNNMLVGLAVGDNVKDIDIINIKCQAAFIITVENEIGLLVGKKELESTFPMDDCDEDEAYEITESRLEKLKDELLDEFKK